jgi:hypothetical protein
MSEHREHEAGTVSECRQCAALAYEPSWYASLTTWAQAGGSARSAQVRTAAA